MSNKTTCPGCDSRTSVLSQVSALRAAVRCQRCPLMGSLWAGCIRRHAAQDHARTAPCRHNPGMGLLAFAGVVLVVLAILTLLGVLHLAAGWTVLLILGLGLIAFSAFVWDVGPRGRS